MTKFEKHEGEKYLSVQEQEKRRIAGLPHVKSSMEIWKEEQQRLQKEAWDQLKRPPAPYSNPIEVARPTSPPAPRPPTPADARIGSNSEPPFDNLLIYLFAFVFFWWVGLLYLAWLLGCWMLKRWKSNNLIREALWPAGPIFVPRPKPKGLLRSRFDALLESVRKLRRPNTPSLNLGDLQTRMDRDRVAWLTSIRAKHSASGTSSQTSDEYLKMVCRKLGWREELAKAPALPPTLMQRLKAAATSVLVWLGEFGRILP